METSHVLPFYDLSLHYGQCQAVYASIQCMPSLSMPQAASWQYNGPSRPLPPLSCGSLLLLWGAQLSAKQINSTFIPHKQRFVPRGL